MKNAIFIAFDDNYINNIFVCLNSLKKNFPNHPPLLINYIGKNKKILNYLNSIEDVSLIDESLEQIINLKLPLHPHISNPIVYAKYLLWTNLFEEYDSIMHLDADTIILNPFEELFSRNEFFIVSNNLRFFESRIFKRKFDSEYYLNRLLTLDGLQFPDSFKDMANAGMFVIPKKYRTTDQFRKLYEISLLYSPYVAYGDQSLISLWCLKNRIKFSEEFEYNFQMPIYTKLLLSRYPKRFKIPLYFFNSKTFLNQVKILHYSGRYKPGSKKFSKWRLMGSCSKIIEDLYDAYLN